MTKRRSLFAVVLATVAAVLAAAPGASAKPAFKVVIAHSNNPRQLALGNGSLYVGAPETVARKMASAIETLDVGRFDMIYTTGAQPASARMRAVELYGSEVIPMVRELVGAGSLA